MTYPQMESVCPQCGSAAGVHSIEELAAMARARLGQVPGPAAGPQPGPGAQPGHGAGPQPGWAAEPQAGPLPGPGGRRQSYPSASGPVGMPGNTGLGDLSFGDDIAGAALGMAARFIGRSVGRRVQDKLAQQVMPAMAAKQQDLLRQQIAIAERHPDLRACLTDQVVFLAGGSRVVPMPNLAAVTVEQSDVLVARLRDG